MCDIFREERLLRLVRSGQAALPVTATFWADWARGLGVEPRQLAEDIRVLQEAGVVAGARGEANVAQLGVTEAIFASDRFPDPDAIPTVVRWRVRTDDGRELVAAAILGGADEPPEGALMSSRWWKVGLQFDWAAEARGESLLEPSRDRTPLLRDIDQQPPKERTSEMEALWKAATASIVLDPSVEPWEELARRSERTAEEARKGLGQLIVDGPLRRFGLAINPTRAGLQGIGMARWDLEGEDAEGAARALSATRGVVEVCIRQDNNGRSALYALLGGRAPDSGRETAENISRQWNRPLAEWTGLRFISMD